MANGQEILICDDQPMIHETLGVYLENEGFTYCSAYDGEQALQMFDSKKPDLVILDLMMPKKSGTEVCREIRAKSRTPIIMLTAKGEEIERIVGLELGADDYIVKPFSAREVVARIKAVLRRFNTDGGVQSQVIRRPGLEINIANYDVRINGESIPFTPKEVEILYLLASNPGRVFDRENILSKVWGYDFFGDTRAVDTQIKRIRQKLPDEDIPWSIKTVYGVGKIEDIFDHHGITRSNHAAGNPACMQATFEAMDEDFDGLLFVNLVDFDMVYGHRRDVKGYAAALETFDAQLPEIQAKMGEDDLLMITADHGCDPCHSGTDHTREHTPLLVWGRKMQGGVNLGVRETYADISATVLDYFGLANPLRGTSFLEELK